MNTPSLFDDAPEVTIPAARKLARTGDPATSRQAAAEIVASLNALQKWAAECVAESPGLTQRELAGRYCPTDPRKIGRRLHECERRGLVRRGDARPCSVSGRSAETWWPVKEGGAS